VVVKSKSSGRKREFDPTPDKTLTRWDAGITLFPGVNSLGYVVKYDNDRQEVRNEDLIDVEYRRLPIIAGALPVNAEGKSIGDLTLAVLSQGAAPTELWVGANRVQFRTFAKPFSLFGTPLWVVQANGVSVNDDQQRLKQLAVGVRNADGESQRVNVAVLGNLQAKVPAPEIRLSRNGSSIPDGEELPTVGDPMFRFEMKLISETRLTRVELWQGVKNNPTGEEVGKFDPAAAVEVPGGGFELRATPILRLRAGLNTVRVVTTNGGNETTTSFRVSYNPPPVRVVMDSIKEPNGKTIHFTGPDAVPNRVVDVATGVIEVEGHIEWTFDDEPVSRDRDLSVVFMANGVSHLPVKVQDAHISKDVSSPGGVTRTRKFSGRVYLNANGNLNPKATGKTLVTLDLRSGGRPIPTPRQSISFDEIAVTSENPVRKQRFHVVMLGVEVPDAQRQALVRNVIEGFGGEVPKDAVFTEGRFTHKNFEFAYLYSPRLGYTKAGDLNALLNAVRADITDRSKRQNDEWVNDVILVCYQGAILEDERMLLHTATTLSGAAGKNPNDYAIRMDHLPQTPGLRFMVVIAPKRERVQPGLNVGEKFLVCLYGDSDALKQLFARFGDALKFKPTLGEITQEVAKNLTPGAVFMNSLQSANARFFGLLP
jgi:hypothetical protein